MKQTKSSHFILILLLFVSLPLSGQDYDSAFYQKKIHTKVDVLPEFPGGLDSLLKYEKINLKCPEKAKRKKVYGRVFMMFIVNRIGLVDSARISVGLSTECDREALRLIRSLPRFKPGMINGVRVNTSMYLPIKFDCY